MATYAIKAPNGQTYQVAGPDGATDEQVRAEVLRQHPDAASAPPPPAKGRTLLGALGEGLWNLPGHTAQAWHAATVDLPDTLADPKRRAAAGQAMGDALTGAVDTAKGYLQQTRDLSPPEFRGSAPRMNTAPAAAMERSVVGKYGVNVAPQRLAAALSGNLGEANLNAYRTFKDDVAEHPLATALMVAPVAAKPVGAVAGRLMPAAAKLNPIPVAARVLDAGATPAAEKVRTAALGKVLAQQEAAVTAEAEAARLKAADKPLRATMESAAAAQAAKGIGVSDLPEAKAFVSELEDRLHPAGQVVTTPTTDQAKAYRSIILTLSPANGQKPSLAMIQNLRRELAETAYGGADPQGYAAIGKIERRDLVNRLHDIEDAYTGGASAPVRENWAAAKEAGDSAEDLSKLRAKLQTDAAQLDTYQGAEAVKRARAIVTKLSNRGLVPDDEYREFLELANAASDAAGKSKFRKRLALYAAGAAGVSATGAGIAGHGAGILP
jgi:hypothetical protein